MKDDTATTLPRLSLLKLSLKLNNDCDDKTASETKSGKLSVGGGSVGEITDSNRPSLCLSNQNLNSFTSEILPYLLISTSCDGLLEDEHHLLELGVEFLVNCCHENGRRGVLGKHLTEGNRFTILNLDLRDESTQSLSFAFSRFFPLARRAKEEKKKCLIYCHSGMSRSVSLVLAYLLACERMSLIDAMTYVKERRHVASPNPGFMAQLITLERVVTADVTVDLDRYKSDRFGHPGGFALELRGNRDDKPDKLNHRRTKSDWFDLSKNDLVGRRKHGHKKNFSESLMLGDFAADVSIFFVHEDANRAQDQRPLGLERDTNKSDLFIVFEDDKNKTKSHKRSHSDNISIVVVQNDYRKKLKDIKRTQSESPTIINRNFVLQDEKTSNAGLKLTGSIDENSPLNFNDDKENTQQGLNRNKLEISIDEDKLLQQGKFGIPRNGAKPCSSSRFFESCSSPDDCIPVMLGKTPEDKDVSNAFFDLDEHTAPTHNEVIANDGLDILSGGKLGEESKVDFQYELGDLFKEEHGNSPKTTIEEDNTRYSAHEAELGTNLIPMLEDMSSYMSSCVNCASASALKSVMMKGINDMASFSEMNSSSEMTSSGESSERPDRKRTNTV
mmetsp:Transcript_48571/g.72061  ORF Transcript_48571/g.72061 Transcript_48571/m.72061 type:complete len:615 (+) Transcript_48571:188-2032(+)|eukprot:CAMPEP_0195527268 /NCGR_PEP_ID=MMETSP0794_2-20130614/28803_1 /TAXON_ID=515487 /ORGANISM="Stephanopyxis turris, Strain CCMP 815" /LENGTH=614 /DNA_ID=CAMNT_0040658139 /DNA_START=183 /DNA_END=2027 /DNA_ORIENTATION=-